MAAPPVVAVVKDAPVKAEHAPPDARDLLIAIDAGHGGVDPGATGKNGTREKDVVLAIARELALQINAEPGMRAILIRDGDYFVPLRDRMQRARKRQADLFVSVHADSIRDRNVSGSSVYILSQRGATNEASRWLAERENAADLVGGVSLENKDDVLASVLLDLSQTAALSASQDAASSVLRRLDQIGEIRKRQVQQAGFVVLKSPDIPSLLIETAYISNPGEEQRLRSRGYQGKIAVAINQGLKDFFYANPPAGTLVAQLAAQKASTPKRRCSPPINARECSRPPQSKTGKRAGLPLISAPVSIRALPQVLINQIAAGEVIERPASVIKELVENALDAGATRIDVELDRGGLALIRVRDDGGGIPSEQLPLALAPHATSKIASLDDLECVASLGFRGEALASIASVSRLTLTSRQLSSDHAWRIVSADADSAPVIPAAQNPGTCVDVQDLFYNVPARRKFLRSEQVELQHIARMLERLALSRFEVGFSLTHNGRQLWKLLPAPSSVMKLARIAKICGEEFAAHVIEINHNIEALHISGWLGLPTFSRSQADLQFAFVNGRFVRDKLLTSAARLAYQDVMFHGRFAAYLLYVSLDPARVDVNAHPQKLEVRFRDPRSVHDFVFRTLQSALAQTRPTESAQGSAPSDWLTGSAAYASSGEYRQHDFRMTPAAEGVRDVPGVDTPGVAIRRASPRRASRWRRKRCRRCRLWDMQSRNCTAFTSWRRRRKAWCWWTCMQPTSGFCTSA